LAIAVDVLCCQIIICIGQCSIKLLMAVRAGPELINWKETDVG